MSPQVWPAAPVRIAAGTVSSPRGTWLTVPFPAGLFSEPPVVMLTVNTGVGTANGATVRTTAVTESSFNITTSGGGSGSATTAWVAFQI